MIVAHQLTKTFKDKKRGVIAAVSDVSFTCSPAASTACSARTAPARRRRCACSPRCCGR
ncbi:MAG: hypothetical protein WDM96_14465 [Lacunisphaera sp.]